MSKEPQKTSHTNLANESKSEQTKQKTFNLQMNVSDTLLKKLKDNEEKNLYEKEKLLNVKKAMEADQLRQEVKNLKADQKVIIEQNE